IRTDRNERPSTHANARRCDDLRGRAALLATLLGLALLREARARSRLLDAVGAIPSPSIGRSERSAWAEQPQVPRGRSPVPPRDQREGAGPPPRAADPLPLSLGDQVGRELFSASRGALRGAPRFSVRGRVV